MSKHDPHGTAASVNGMANTLARVTEWAAQQVVRTHPGDGNGMSAEQFNMIGKVVLGLIEGVDPEEIDATEVSHQILGDDGLQRVADMAAAREAAEAFGVSVEQYLGLEPLPKSPHAELIETLQEILSTLDRIKDRLTPKPMRVQR